MKFAGDKKKGTSILAVPEGWLKSKLLPLVPSWIETYHLTASTVLWGFGVIAFSFLARYNIRFLWGASVMIFLQYITDLLDGAIGRQRDTGLVKWGYYMDHFLDFFFLCCIIIGYGFLVPARFMYILLFILALFGSFMVNSFLSFSATNAFRISYFGIGPTEVRIVFIAVNTLLILFGKTYLTSALPYVLGFGTMGLFITVYRTQQKIWAIDMKEKYPDADPGAAAPVTGDSRTREPEISRVRKRHAAAVILSFLMAGAAFAVFATRTFHPYDRAAAAALYAAGWVVFIAAVWKYRAYIRRHAAAVRVYGRAAVPYACAAVLLIGAAYAAYTFIPVAENPLTGMTPGDLREMIDNDADRLRLLRSSNRRIVDRISTGGLVTRPFSELSPGMKKSLIEQWSKCVTGWLEFDMLKKRYEGFYQIDYLSQPSLHADAFCTAFAGFAAQLRSALKVLDAISDNTSVETFLDEKHSGHSLPAETLTCIKKWTVHPDTHMRLHAGNVYLRLVREDLKVPESLRRDLDMDLDAVSEIIRHSPGKYIDIPLDIFQKKAFSLWYPLQKEAAVRLSLMRTAKRGFFISENMIAGYADEFEPGDICIERRNWYMTNIGIPGFWPHAALYTGTLEQMDEYFSDISDLAGEPFSEYLKKHMPEVYAEFIQNDDKGYRRCIIEAKRPGVILTSLEQSGNADYMAVMRARIPKREKFAAVKAALSYYGRPYDFNFDFATDSALVCSELVYKAFQHAGSITFPAGRISGRIMMTPNDIARTYAEEYGTPGRRLDLVLFLDGSEADNKAYKKTAEEFADTWKRPKWDIMQK